MKVWRSLALAVVGLGLTVGHAFAEDSSLPDDPYKRAVECAAYMGLATDATKGVNAQLSDQFTMAEVQWFTKALNRGHAMGLDNDAVRKAIQERSQVVHLFMSLNPKDPRLITAIGACKREAGAP